MRVPLVVTTLLLVIVAFFYFISISLPRSMTPRRYAQYVAEPVFPLSLITPQRLAYAATFICMLIVSMVVYQLAVNRRRVETGSKREKDNLE